MSVTGTSALTSLGPDAFMKMFITQLQHQDPTQPMDPSQMVQSLSQLTSVQTMNQLNTSFQASLQTEQLRLAKEMIGSQVSFGTPDSPQTGVVQSAAVQQGQAGVIVAGAFVPVASVTQIAPAAN